MVDECGRCLVTENERIYDSLMAQGKRAEADAYAEAHMEDEEEFDSPMECDTCELVFDSAVHFITKPFRAVCPNCGHVHHTEKSWDYYIEY